MRPLNYKGASLQPPGEHASRHSLATANVAWRIPIHSRDLPFLIMGLNGKQTMRDVYDKHPAPHPGLVKSKIFTRTLPVNTLFVAHGGALDCCRCGWHSNLEEGLFVSIRSLTLAILHNRVHCGPLASKRRARQKGQFVTQLFLLQAPQGAPRKPNHDGQGANLFPEKK
jgi:hypothetical protein